MTEIEVVAKRWGSSIGVIIPNSVVETEHIVENEIIKLEIIKNHTASEVWGLIPKGWKKTTQELKNEARKGWD
jgi:antitoxin component of MazEF toxin-antitoxin module